uniref:Uncharacterized protein n=1 Tax=Amphimedon queenslandica TaxID=400682 RepID=A0A1X7SNL5_AMPQE
MAIASRGKKSRILAAANITRPTNPPSWQEILTHFRGSELQNYFTKIVEYDLKACIKPQYVDQIPKAVKGTVNGMLDKKNEMGVLESVCEQFGKQRN